VLVDELKDVLVRDHDEGVRDALHERDPFLRQPRAVLPLEPKRARWSPGGARWTPQRAEQKQQLRRALQRRAQDRRVPPRITERVS
jgi:hypothetical protein